MLEKKVLNSINFLKKVVLIINPPFSSKKIIK